MSIEAQLAISIADAEKFHAEKPISDEPPQSIKPRKRQNTPCSHYQRGQETKTSPRNDTVWFSKSTCNDTDGKEVEEDPPQHLQSDHVLFLGQLVDWKMGKMHQQGKE